MMISCIKKLVLLLLLLISITIEAQDITTKLTDKQHFQVSYSSKLDPITINMMHAWIIRIENNKQQAVLNAEISVDGGMPAHNHGLPTHPQVTKNIGEGNYLLEGMKFHMGGWWQVTISIVDGNVSDSVTFDLNL